MTKRDKATDLFNAMVPGPQPLSSSSMSTAEPPEEERLELVSLRLPPSMKNRLQQHFRRKGLKLSAGIRMLLAEYIDRERPSRP